MLHATQLNLKKSDQEKQGSKDPIPLDNNILLEAIRFPIPGCPQANLMIYKLTNLFVDLGLDLRPGKLLLKMRGQY